METAILAKGQESIKMAFGEIRTVFPAVCSQREGQDLELGIGLLDVKTGAGWFHGYMFPHNLIQCWRAMKLLGKLALVDEEVLEACWHAFNNRRPHHSKIRHYISLTVQFSCPESFHATREELIASGPSVEELEEMVIAAVSNGVFLDCIELMRETKRGMIELSEKAKEAIADQRDKLLVWQLRKNLGQRKQESAGGLWKILFGR